MLLKTSSLKQTNDNSRLKWELNWTELRRKQRLLVRALGLVAHGQLIHCRREKERDPSLKLSTPDLTKSKRLHYLVCMCWAWLNACSTRYGVEKATSRSHVFCINGGKRWPWGHSSHVVTATSFIRSSQLIDKLYYLVDSSVKTAKLIITFRVTVENKTSEHVFLKQKHLNKASQYHKLISNLNEHCLYW